MRDCAKFNPSGEIRDFARTTQWDARADARAPPKAAPGQGKSDLPAGARGVTSRGRAREWARTIR